MDCVTFCLFCREKNIPYDIHHQDEGKGPSFDKLCEYLKINVDRYCCQRYKDLPLFSEIRSDDKKAKNAVKLLCLNCFELIYNLHKLYQDLEKIKSAIEVSRRNIKSVIIAASAKSDAAKLLGKGRKRGRRTKTVDKAFEFVETFHVLVKESQEKHCDLEPLRTEDTISAIVIPVSKEKSNSRYRKCADKPSKKRKITVVSEEKISAAEKGEQEPVDATNVKIEVEPADEDDQDDGRPVVENEVDNMLLESNDMDVDETGRNNVDDTPNVESAEVDIKFDIDADGEGETRRKSTRISKMSKEKHGIAIINANYNVPSKPKRQYKCRVCQQIFCSAHQYFTHRKSHIPAESKSLNIRSVYGIVNGRKQVVTRICSICGHKVHGSRNLSIFTEHMLSHEKFTLDHSTPVYSCDQCDKQFNIELNLDLHRRYNHEWHHIIRLKCELCGEACKTQPELVLHLKTHDGVTRTHSCRSCPMACSTLDKLLAHMVKHSRSKQLHCPECPNFVAITLKELYEHCEKTHSEIKEKITCSHCDKTFRLPATFQQHLRDTHEMGEKDNKEEGGYFCSKCNNGKIYKLKRSLRKHVREYHTEESIRFKCDHCSKGFLYNSQLQKHILERHERIRYPCPHCSKTYSEQVSLGHHLKIHTGEGLLHCHVCGKQFTRKNQLKVHLVIHEPKITENCVVCETCGKEFPSETRLQQHKQNHKEKNLKCPYCKMVFRRRDNFKSHLRTHTGERPFVCSICMKGFNRKDILVVHMKCHDMSMEEAKQFCKQDNA